MRKTLQLLCLLASFTSISQTPISDDNFIEAINACLSTNPVDGLCTDSEFGAMPDWDVSNVTNMEAAFYHLSTFDADLSLWDVSSVTNMRAMFANADDFNSDVSDWDVSSVTNMEATFYGAITFNSNLSTWDVSSVINMGGMFASTLVFNSDISSWDVSNVTRMARMFDFTFAFDTDISSWDVSNVTSMESMFFRASVFNSELGDWDISKVIDMRNMFDYSSLSTSNYDITLIGWSQQDVKSAVLFDARGINFCLGNEARNSLIVNKDWIITDQGYDCTTVGVDQDAMLNISIYPNPTFSLLFIEGNHSELEVSLFDILGNMVHQQKVMSELDISNLPEGLYVLKILDGHITSSHKIIKR